MRSGLLARILVLVAICFAAPSLHAQHHEAIPTDTTFIAGQLENGLRYYIRHNQEPKARAELRLVVNAGSVLEDDDQLGLAHLLEHMAFNGTLHFERQMLIDYLERVGMRFGPDINAYTSFDETVYMLTLPTDTAGVLDTGLMILEDWARGIMLDSLEIEKERGVVLEEWRLGQGAGSRIQRQQFPVLMQRSRYADRLPIGTRESLESFEHEALRRFYRDWYRPDLMAVVAVGDFDAAEMEEKIRERFSLIPVAAEARERREFDVPGHRDTRVSIATDPEAQGSTVSLYMKREPVTWQTVDAYRGWMVESLASSMLTNRLSEATQQPDAPFLDVSSFHGRFIRPLAAYILTIRTENGGVERGLEALLTETSRVAQHGFTSTELEREKRDVIRGIEQRFTERERTSSGAFAADYVSHFLYGGTIVDAATEYELYQRFLPEITLAEVNEHAKLWMQDHDRVVLVHAPEGDEHVVPDERTVRRIIETAPQRTLQPYADAISSAPLVRDLPPPGRVVEEREFAEVGVHEWVLSNGARVLLKPTDFREDEVLMAARSPGGTSLVDDEDFVAALTATAVVQVAGMGEFSSVELRKHLAGSVAGVGAEMGELHEGLSGAASPRDLETLFQLIHLKFRAPRVDSAAFLAYQAQARAAMNRRAASPESAFLDTIRVVLSQNHPRARPTTVETFDRLDMARSLEIYRERFGDAGDFTFYFVGNLDLEEMRPLVERYLANLPSNGRVEEGRDLGIRPPSGIVRRTLRRGLEPKALTRIIFTGEFTYDQPNLYALSALGEVLQLRLREVLREEMSGTYGASVTVSGTPKPWPHYRFSISFGSEPERLPELTGAVFGEIEALRSYGPSELDLHKVREMMIRDREVEVRRNHFWMQQILVHDRNGWELTGINEHGSRVAALDVATLQAAALTYLDPDNHIHLTLLPEKGTAGGDD